MLESKVMYSNALQRQAIEHLLYKQMSMDDRYAQDLAANFELLDKQDNNFKSNTRNNLTSISEQDDRKLASPENSESDVRIIVKNPPKSMLLSLNNSYILPKQVRPNYFNVSDLQDVHLALEIEKE